jgi:Flp pilus assembly protein TadG
VILLAILVARRWGPALLASRPRGQDGAIAVVSGLVAVVLLLISAFVVDLGSTWARRGQLQIQADKAALLAAQSLPAVDADSRKKVAKYAAYYIACHTLPGQRQLNPDIPDCPSGTTPNSSAVLAYAQQLLDSGSVSFPKSTQVKVVTPSARIDYGFGRVAGVDGSTQRKIAIAQASSPGGLLPIGLSLPCLLSAAGNVPAAGDPLSAILPINYVTPGPLTPAAPPAATVWPAGHVTATAGDRPALSSVNTLPDPVVSGPVPAEFTLTGSNWGDLGSLQVVFHKGPDTTAPVPAASLQVPVLDLVTGTASVVGVLPDAVMQDPGTWEVKVGVNRALAGPYWSDPMPLDVTLPAGATEALGCGRLLDSPRSDEPDPALALERNLQEGLDHELTGHPNLLTVTAPELAPDDAVALASNPMSAFDCVAAPPHVLDVSAPSGTPNCVRLQGNDGWVGTSFTAGMLEADSGGTAGRLVCSAARPCTGPSATVGGVSINDDDFDDFVVDQNLLRDRLFFGLSTYITNGLPFLTPENALSDELYSSHRFMWVPVMSAPLTPTSGGDYPVLTFRPIFITQDAPTGWNAYDMLWDESGALLASLGLAEDDVEHGLLMGDDGTLKGMRFMTIEPRSLPPVPEDYNGPTTDYIGIGPKLVKLVK